ncbi:MAG: caspase family protein [Sphaerochaeta sp.]
MRKIFFVFAAAALAFFLCSCELSCDAPKEGKLNIVVYGNDYFGEPEVKDENGNVITAADGKAKTASELPCTVNDAINVGNALVKNALKAKRSYQVTYLVGRSSALNFKAVRPDCVVNDVTFEKFKSVLTGISLDSGTQDVTIIYFSGHGAGNEKKEEYGTDTSVSSYMAFGTEDFNYCILKSVKNFMNKVNEIPGTKIVIGDFCFSGALVQSNYFSLTDGEYTGIDAPTLFAEYRDKINESHSTFCLSAARYNESSYENKNLGHGYFTNALLSALGWDENSGTLKNAGAEKDNAITLFNVAVYASEHDGETKQTPMLSGGSNDIVLFSFN